MRRIAFIPVVLTAALMLTTPVSAQTADTQALYDRIDRLERDVQTLEAQAGRGGAPATTVISSPALGGGVSTVPQSSGSAPLPHGMAAQLDDRVDQLEDELRQLTGKVEEANYKAEQALKQLQRMQTDIDLRFKELQPGGAAGTPAAAGPAPSSGGAGAPVPLAGNATIGGNAASGEGVAPGPQVLGTLSSKDLKPSPAAAAAAGAPVLTPPPGLKEPEAPKTPKSMYEDAYKLAQKGDYAGAEEGFRAFLAKYPTNTLAGNAQYWLGDIAFARKDFRQAAGLFGEAYKKYPKSEKAPDMLYKLGASFANLDMKREACRSFAILFSAHPDMPDRVRRAATAQKQKLACE
ncbi:MAG: tol-pal system protein YbgF [Magnetospirillum sp.]|nr:tol-pal system protein YbgF [Magnetospirillum sp.]